MRNRFLIVLGLCAVICVGGTSAAAVIDFDFAESTPIGSWQEREHTTTDEKGKQTVMVMRIGYLGDEERGGEAFAWIEMEMNNYKVKKDKRKPQGDTLYMKVLMKKSALEGDITNALGNFNEMATDVIMQSGDSQPMRIKGAGSMMGGMMQGMGLQVSYTTTKDGGESVTVPAGTFECDRYKGEGSTSVKIMFKTMNMESKNTQWISNKVPFGGGQNGVRRCGQRRSAAFRDGAHHVREIWRNQQDYRRAAGHALNWEHVWRLT